MKFCFSFKNKTKIDQNSGNNEQKSTQEGRTPTGEWYAKLEEDLVEIDPRDFSPDDKEPTFTSKVEESIWRLKNKK